MTLNAGAGLWYNESVMTTPPARILYCHCAYAQVVPKAVKEQVLQKLADSGVAFDAVADLCEMSAKRDPALGRLASVGTGSDAGPLKIVACYPRAVRWLFAAADAPLSAEAVQVLNMRTETAESVVAAVLNDAGPVASPPPAASNGHPHEPAPARPDQELA